MGNGWHEWPLMIFTVFGQCVVGGFIVLAVALLRFETTSLQRQRIFTAMTGLWVLMGLAFVASTLHLGSPLRAFNALNRIGHSALSNEIASGALFFALGGCGWLLAMMKKMPTALLHVWLVITSLLGLTFVWMMAGVYDSIDTIPIWYSLWTPLGFFLTVLTGGPLLGYLLLRVAGFRACGMRALPAVTLLAIIISLVAGLMQGHELAAISSSVQQAAALVPEYGTLMAWRVILLLVALAVWIVPQLKNRQPAVPLLSLAFMLVLAGEMIARGIFYGLHMTVGMAVAG